MKLSVNTANMAVYSFPGDGELPGNLLVESALGETLKDLLLP